MTTHATMLGAILQGTNLDLMELSGSGDDSDDGEGGGGGSGEDSEDGEGNGKDGEDSEGGEDGDPSDGDDSDDGEGSGDGEGSDGDSGDPSEGDGKPSDSESKGKPDGEGSKNQPGGGYSPDDGHDTAKDLLAEMLAGIEAGLKDGNSALEDAVDAKKEEEDADCKIGEQVWRPKSPDKDEVRYASASARNRALANRLREDAKAPTSALRASLRNKFLIARRPQTLHGVRHGRGLSDRRIVNSVIELRSGRRPTRPDWKRKKKEEVTLAVAGVIDQSTSMSWNGGHRKTNAIKASLVVADALDRLGSPCMMVGPRDGAGAYGYYGAPFTPAKHAYHRNQPVILDIFKDWHEGMETAWPRFGSVKADGGTPLSDGIQYALQELNTRPERFRVCLVMTDGEPNNPRVVRRQIRLAAEAGVFVVGVGIGDKEVAKLFPLHVVVPNVADLPKALLKVLQAIIFPKKGKKIVLDGLAKPRFTR